MLTVSAATGASPEIVDAVARMLPLLSRSAPAPSAAELTEIIASPATTLFVARQDGGGSIVGLGVGAYSADVVRERSARSIQMVSRVVRSRGPSAVSSIGPATPSC